jgi:hypothetical protein
MLPFAVSMLKAVDWTPADLTTSSLWVSYPRKFRGLRKAFPFLFAISAAYECFETLAEIDSHEKCFFSKLFFFLEGQGDSVNHYKEPILVLPQNSLIFALSSLSQEG